MQIGMIHPNFSVTNCTTWKYVSMWGQTRGQNFTPLINCRIFPRQVVASAWYHHSFLIFLFPFVEILRISKFQKYVYSFILKYFVHKFLMREFFIDFLFSTSILSMFQYVNNHQQRSCDIDCKICLVSYSCIHFKEMK